MSVCCLIRFFRIGDNQISTGCHQQLGFIFLDCYHNQLSDLDLTNNIALTELRCQNSYLHWNKQ